MHNYYHEQLHARVYNVRIIIILWSYKISMSPNKRLLLSIRFGSVYTRGKQKKVLKKGHTFAAYVAWIK